MNKIYEEPKICFRSFEVLENVSELTVYDGSAPDIDDSDQSGETFHFNSSN